MKLKSTFNYYGLLALFLYITLVFGFYIDENVALAHRRLSVIDLSDAGNQPMHSSSGRYAIVYNGEIYNFKELRDELELDGIIFKTKTDTEVLLELYAQQGERCLLKLNGMFSIAIWDKEDKVLFLARDRLGKKPLYYCQNGEAFVFASELKSLLILTSFSLIKADNLVSKRVNCFQLFSFKIFFKLSVTSKVLEEYKNFPPFSTKLCTYKSSIESVTSCF